MSRGKAHLLAGRELEGQLRQLARASLKLLHIWIILVIVLQHLVQSGRIDGPIECNQWTYRVSRGRAHLLAGRELEGQLRQLLRRARLLGPATMLARQQRHTDLHCITPPCSLVTLLRSPPSIGSSATPSSPGVSRPLHIFVENRFYIVYRNVF